jgi:hypothetical protein
MNDRTPRVFISYSWSNNDRVIELAQRLMGDGVDIVLDKWELKEGQDKYAFMERSVTDDSIDKVLLICDKQYAEKANNRIGGVGDETTVISPEVYSKTVETKFIPIIFELDENGDVCVPIYLKSRKYIDLTQSEHYEKNYESLIRVLHDKPENRKPLLGKAPEWLNDETIDFSGVRNILNQVRNYDGKNSNKINFILRNFNGEFIRALIDLSPSGGDGFDERLIKQIEAVKPLRDMYIDYIELCIMNGFDIATILTDFFERVYNETHDTRGAKSYINSDFEFYDFSIWECFICATVLLLHYEKFSEIHKILTCPYFLKSNYFNASSVEPYYYQKFRGHFETIEFVCKPKSSKSNLFTMAGNILISREKKPIIDKIALANADLVLYQLSIIFDMEYWFPWLYCYCERAKQAIWSKLISKSYCEKIMPLFGVTTIIPELKELICKSVQYREIRYNSSADSAKCILDSINIDEVATIR